jgi:hypothetical protein
VPPSQARTKPCRALLSCATLSGAFTAFTAIHGIHGIHGSHDMHDMHDMHDWLLGLTRPEDHLAWAWIAIAAGYALVGIISTKLRRPPHARHTSR